MSKKKCWSWRNELSKKKECWMCNKEKYTFLDKKEVPINRVLEDKESKDYYVVVPRDPHLFGHILIVLRKHINSLRVPSPKIASQ